ncbi:hypothetical protein [Phenylobacterium ferrooxidans]|uniref:Uncharacterized protein n=1 Tax=Phenylobacterium ferrooxidans TaxID=2982689 RepID=A0ABW6CI21_9CAUL
MSTLFAALAAAAALLPPLLPSSYTLVCQVEQSTGYNWQAGNWSRTNFKPDSYIVQIGGENQCKSAVGTVTDYTSVKFREVCGNLRKIGSEYLKFMSMECLESYGNVPEQAPRIVQCHSSEETFAGAVDGWFHHTHIHGQVGARPRNDEKDSLYVEVGKCSLVK